MLAIIALLMMTAAFGSFRNTLLHFLPDDCFYYLEISRRIWMGQGSTFDGINATNGYHPLWLVVLIPLAPIMNVSREAGARVVMVLCVMLLGPALFCFRAVVARYSISSRWVGLLLPAAVLLPAAFYGMESALAALIFTTLLLAIALLENSPTIGSGVIVGLLSGLLILARLDSVVYVFAFDLVWALRVWRGGKSRSALLVCLALQAIVVSPYVAFNLIEFRHLLPISAVFKVARAQAPNLYWARSLMALVSIAGTVVGLFVTWWEPRVRSSLGWITAVTGGALTLVIAVVSGGKESYSWNFTLPVIGCGLFAAVLVDLVKRREWPAGLVNAAALAGCFVLLAVSIAGRVGEPQFASRFDRAKWIGANAPANAVFAAGNCGGLGYLSGHSFVNLDGLTNGFAFEQAIRDDRVAEWLRGAGVNYATRVKTSPIESPGSDVVKTRFVVRGNVTRSVCLTLEPLSPQVSNDKFELLKVTEIERCP